LNGSIIAAQELSLLTAASIGLVSAASNKVTAGALTWVNRLSRLNNLWRSRSDWVLSASLRLSDIEFSLGCFGQQFKNQGTGIQDSVLPTAAAGFVSAASKRVTAGPLTAAKRPSRRNTARRSREDKVV
jgi:hypothetical protein